MSELTHAMSCLVRGVPALIKGGVPGDRAGVERLIVRHLRLTTVASIPLTSSAFQAGGKIPRRFTADGQNVSPPLRWGPLPNGTRSTAVVVEDPDAPLPRPFVHWLLYGMQPETLSLAEGVPLEGFDLGLQGRNSLLKVGYTGAAPPEGDLPHHYHFQFFALDRVLPFGSGVGRSTVVKSMRGHVIGFGELIGLYQRPKHG